MGNHDSPIMLVERVCKAYDESFAITDLSLPVAEGIFLTLLGPSGCGKSTLLRMIGGLVRPSAGRILLRGRDITHAPAYTRDVNMVFQDYALFPHMTVAQNIAFGCQMKRLSRAETERRIAELLDLVRLPDAGARYPDQLSGGQQQRIALARALAPDPAVLLLDEPLGALDRRLRVEMQQELRSIQRRTGKTFVFVTHDQEEALSMSDQIVVMRQGAIEQIGTPLEIYSQPASAFVAGFIGETNLIACRVLAADSNVARLEISLGPIDATATFLGAFGDLHPGEVATVSVRPEAIRLGSSHQGPVFQGEIDEVSYRGNRHLVRIRAGGGDGTTMIAELRADELPTSRQVLFGWDFCAMSVIKGQQVRPAVGRRGP